MSFISGLRSDKSNKIVDDDITANMEVDITANMEVEA